jgi:hypothetical protein
MGSDSGRFSLRLLVWMSARLLKWPENDRVFGFAGDAGVTGAAAPWLQFFRCSSWSAMRFFFHLHAELIEARQNCHQLPSWRASSGSFFGPGRRPGGWGGRCRRHKSIHAAYVLIGNKWRQAAMLL